MVTKKELQYMADAYTKQIQDLDSLIENYRTRNSELTEKLATLSSVKDIEERAIARMIRRILSGEDA